MIDNEGVCKNSQYEGHNTQLYNKSPCSAHIKYKDESLI